MSNKTVASLSVLAGLAFQALIPASAHAWPFSRLLHRHPAAILDADGRITVQLFNRGEWIQHVNISGRSYSILPHHGLDVTAPEGTPVYALNDGFGHRQGQLLFTVSRKTGRVVRID